jgi:hypothetical protein
MDLNTGRCPAQSINGRTLLPYGDPLRSFSSQRCTPNVYQTPARWSIPGRSGPDPNFERHHRALTESRRRAQIETYAGPHPLLLAGSHRSQRRVGSALDVPGSWLPTSIQCNAWLPGRLSVMQMPSDGRETHLSET